jgi:competence protein ComEA
MTSMRQAVFSAAVGAWAVALAGVAVSAAGRQAAAAPSGEGLPDGPGKDVMVRICGVCHEPRRAASVRLTRDGWSDLIQEMVRRGAKGSDQELAQVLDYLSTNFLGEAPRPVNVNSAPAIDLESVIGLLRKEAAAVVAYREKNGPFATIDDLKEVPGLDFKKIEAAKDRIVCFPPGPA